MEPNPPGQYADGHNLRACQRLWRCQVPFFDITAWVLDVAGVVPGMRVLDVGCGNGIYLRALRERRVTTVGCDLSPGALRGAAHPALGIDTRHYAVLVAMPDGNGPSQQDVADALGIDRATLVALADDLEAKQLIARARSDQDRRAYALTLASDGTAPMNQAHLDGTVRGRAHRRADSAERSQLAEPLARLLAAAP